MIDCPENMLKHSLEISYEIYNFSSYSISTVIEDYVTLTPKPPDGWLVYERIVVEREGGDITELAGSELQDLTSQSELTAGYKIPLDIKPSETVRFQITRNLVANERDHHTMSMSLLTENFRFTSECSRRYYRNSKYTASSS